MLATLLGLTAVAAAQALPGWMTGCWIEERGARWTEECWTMPRAGTMLGSGRAGKDTALSNWETMQILPDAEAGLAFWGAPSGVGRTRFALISQTVDQVVFVNRAHDYPQRIRYWRDGAGLNAEISLADGTKAMRWQYRKLG